MVEFNPATLAGLTWIDPRTLAVINDNDFGVASIIVNKDGTFILNYTPEPIQLGIIETNLNGLDASDQDKKINIRQWPVKGMYQPDAIASYRVGAHTFLVTANEGDAREYDGLRGSRAASILSDRWIQNGSRTARRSRTAPISAASTSPTPWAEISATGLYEELFAFGARSFSIWSDSGKLVFDSRDALELITAKATRQTSTPRIPTTPLTTAVTTKVPSQRVS